MSKTTFEQWMKSFPSRKWEETSPRFRPGMWSSHEPTKEDLRERVRIARELASKKETLE